MLIGITDKELIKPAKQTQYRALKWLRQAFAEGFIMLFARNYKGNNQGFSNLKKSEKIRLFSKDLGFKLKQSV